MWVWRVTKAWTNATQDRVAPVGFASVTVWVPVLPFLVLLGATGRKSTPQNKDLLTLPNSHNTWKKGQTVEKARKSSKKEEKARKSPKQQQGKEGQGCRTVQAVPVSGSDSFSGERVVSVFQNLRGKGRVLVSVPEGRFRRFRRCFRFRVRKRGLSEKSIF